MRSAEAAAKTRQEAIQSALNTLGAELHQVHIEILDEGSRGLFGFGARDVRVRLTLDDDEFVSKPRKMERRDREPQPQGATKPERREDKEKPQHDRPRRSDRPARSESKPAAAQTQQPKAERAPRPERAPKPPREPREPREEKKPAREPQPPAEELAPVTDARREEATALLSEVLEKMAIPATVTSKLGEDGRALLSVESTDSAILIGRKGRNLQALQYLLNRMMRTAEVQESNERFVVDVESYLDRHKSTLEEMALHLAAKAKETGRDVRVKPLNPQDRRIIHLTLQDDPDIRTFSLGNSSIRTVVISPKTANQESDRPRRGRRGQGGRRPRRYAGAGAPKNDAAESSSSSEGEQQDN